MPNKLASQDAITEDCMQWMWTYLPDNLLLFIFQYLSPRKVLDVSQVCCQWHRVALDEFLWRDLFYRYFKIDRRLPMAPGMSSWRFEFKRLVYHIPAVESEVLRDHKDQVLHVSFAHNGQLFATTSKDGFIKVWSTAYPCTLKYYADMKEYTWKYTQFSQFNSSDTLLLVSGVHFGSHSTSGEIAVFSIDSNFELQCRVLNKPYDIFGAWYNNSYLLSGNLYWRGNFSSSSVLKLNKASQAIESEHESVVTCLYNFLNQNASSIRTILVARCPEERQETTSSIDHDKGKTYNRMTTMLKVTGKGVAAAVTSSDDDESDVSSGVESLEECDVLFGETVRCGETMRWPSTGDLEEDCAFAFGVDTDENASSSYSGSHPRHQRVASARTVSPMTKDSATDHRSAKRDDVQSDLKQPGRLKASGSSLVSRDKSCRSQGSVDDDFCDKFLIFTMGEKTYTPHQIGIKRIMAAKAKEITERLKQRDVRQQTLPNELEDPMQHAAENDKFDSVDHMIELHGHIIGMCLSPDHRFLYVNSRSWPKGYEISDPLSPPPIAEEIDIHVIDLETLTEVGASLLRSHKAYTPNDECFFIFLDVSAQYIASGAEDKHGYMWDRHYGIHLRKFQHNDVVNSVAFNSQDSEVLVTVSDDYSIKIWRSENREKEVKEKYVRQKEVRQKEVKEKEITEKEVGGILKLRDLEAESCGS